MNFLPDCIDFSQCEVKSLQNRMSLVFSAFVCVQRRRVLGKAVL